MNIIIATIRQWNIYNAMKLKNLLEPDYNIHIISEKNKLTLDFIHSISPQYIFFPHWSWKIPKSIFKNYTCILFHMTNLPFGRGGSPLQNLISQKIYATKISAITVEEEIDSGKIYLQKDLYIGLGSAEEIYLTASEIIFFEMIPFILKNKITPKPQEGTPTFFKRRSPEESNIMKANLNNLNDFFDFIRMLDATDYPKAFIEVGKFKITFSEIHKKTNKLVGRFEVIENEHINYSSTP